MAASHESAERVRRALDPTTWNAWLPHSIRFTPWWRWGCASHLVSAVVPQDKWPDEADTHVRRLVRFMSSGNPTCDEALWAAFEVFIGPPSRRALVEAYLLTGEPIAIVSKRTGLKPAAIKVYKQVFCDVGERMEASDWIVRWFILGASRDLPSVVEVELKRFGYFGSLVALDALVAASLRFDLLGDVQGLNLPPPPELPVRTLAAARRTLLTAALPDDQVSVLQLIIQATGPRGVSFRVEDGRVTVGVKDALTGRPDGLKGRLGKRPRRPRPKRTSVGKTAQKPLPGVPLDQGEMLVLWLENNPLPLHEDVSGP